MENEWNKNMISFVCGWIKYKSMLDVNETDRISNCDIVEYTMELKLKYDYFRHLHTQN